jgi:hypothetical protein
LSADLLACVNWHRRKRKAHAVRALKRADAMIAAKQSWMKTMYFAVAEAINLDIWIFTPAPQWAPTVVVCDNDLK